MKLWMRIYLPALPERSKWNQKCRNAAVGDFVLVIDDDVARWNWPLAGVTKVFPGLDGCVRSKDMNSHPVRPIQKQCLLEESSTLALGCNEL